MPKYRERHLSEIGQLDRVSAQNVHQAGLQENHSPGELLVQFSPGASAAAKAAALSSVGGHAAEVLRAQLGDQGELVRITFGAGLDVQKAIEIISHRPGVVFAEPNFVHTVDAMSDDLHYTGGQLWGMYGDTTSLTNEFGSQAGEAWATGNTGSSKVVVGVVDSGIDYTHPDLYLNIWLNQNEIPSALRSLLLDVDSDGLIGFRDLNASGNANHVTDLNGNGRIDAGDLLTDARWEDGRDQDLNGYVDDLIGWDFVNNDNDPYDDNNHGTHVSGTIAGMGGNGVGVAGVTWSTQLIGLKFLSASGSGYSSNAIKALDYFTTAAQLSTVQDFAATNNSWGGGGSSRAVLDSVVRGAKQDILFVVAAGNGGSNNDSTAYYPSNYSTVSGAGYEAVIAVASITSSGLLSTFSNYGANTVDLGAPGSGIYSTIPGGGYASFSGTSMAAPHVAGAIALYSSLSSQSSRDIASSLLGSTAATSSLASNTVSGGRLDVTSFLAKVGTAPPPSQTVNDIYGTRASDTISGTTLGEKIWGVPATGTHTGRGTIDTLTGNGGADTFVLGDSSGRFYDDGKVRTAGASDYAVITDFGSDDKIQLTGTAANYVQNAVTLNGVSGMGIYHDTNINGVFDLRDELIAHIQNLVDPVGPTQLFFF